MSRKTLCLQTNVAAGRSNEKDFVSGWPCPEGMATRPPVAIYAVAEGRAETSSYQRFSAP